MHKITEAGRPPRSPSGWPQGSAGSGFGAALRLRASCELPRLKMRDSHPPVPCPPFLLWLKAPQLHWEKEIRLTFDWKRTTGPGVRGSTWKKKAREKFELTVIYPPQMISACTPFSLHLKVKVTQSCPALCDPMDYTVHGILQAGILEWVAFPTLGDLLNPGIKPRSPALQVDSLPAEPQGKPKFWPGFL